MKHVILPGLTTLTDWQSKIKEIDKLKLKEIALFPTGLKYKQRQKLYQLLKRTVIKSIPHVHLTADIREAEIAYLVKEYKTQYFNIHPRTYFKPVLSYKKFLKLIYLENLSEIDSDYYDFLGKSVGLCIDFSHWEDFGVRLHNSGYENFENIVKKNKIGCCHVSAVKNKIGIDPLSRKKCYSRHAFRKLQEFDYLKKYNKYLPKYISLELENSLSEQLKAAKYIKEKII